MIPPATDISIGELGRNLQKIETQLAQLTDKLSALHDAVFSKVVERVDTQTHLLRVELEARIDATAADVAILRKIVHGFVAVVLISVAGAIMSLIIRK